MVDVLEMRVRHTMIPNRVAMIHIRNPIEIAVQDVHSAFGPELRDWHLETKLLDMLIVISKRHAPKKSQY